MYRCLALLSMIFISTLTAYAQKTEAVTAAYTYYAPENISLEEAKHIAVNRAKVEAIANTFGTLVTQNNATVISNKDGETSNRFLSLGGSEIKGEWIETTKEPLYNIKYEQGVLIVSVSLKGVIREIPKSNVMFSSVILRNGTTDKYESDDFRNGDDMFLRFSAPTDGYFVAYMYDETSDMAVCLLPYIADNSQGNVKIKGGEDYVFFKKSSLDDTADEYTLTANSGKPEFEILYLLFSPHPVYMITDEIKRDDIGMRLVPYKPFAKWLAVNRKRADVSVVERMITIKP